ncbi:MAG TPA: SRPBCC family protein [Polyangiaceae bacterium]|nr:SRPBCC family protein [Polyangiaceae bacterium]
MTDSQRIEKKALLRAPRTRVWRAITNAEEFGTWFRAKLDTDFAPGKHLVGRITYPGYEHLRFELFVERLEPETYFSFRWHPHAVDPKVDYSDEPTTLVEFRLEDAEGGTWLTIVESGFERIPAERRALAFRMNDEGWGIQLDNVKQHVAG